MSPAPSLAHTAELSESFSVDVRLCYRYPITLEIEYKLFHQGHVRRLGCGKTLNISSGGVLFEAADALPVGHPIEIRVNWPILLEGVRPLRLVLQGHIVRSEGKLVAVQTERHEFRTAGAQLREHVLV